MRGQNNPYLWLILGMIIAILLLALAGEINL